MKQIMVEQYECDHYPSEHHIDKCDPPFRKKPNLTLVMVINVAAPFTRCSKQQKQHRLFVNHRAPICPVPPIFVRISRAQGPSRSSPGPVSRKVVDGATGECSTSTKIEDIGTDGVRPLCGDSSSSPLVVAPRSLFYPS